MAISKLVFIFVVAIEMQQQSTSTHMWGNGWIVNLFIRIHPLWYVDKCAMSACCAHAVCLVLWACVCVHWSIHRSMNTYEYVRFQTELRDSFISLSTSHSVCSPKRIIYNKSDCKVLSVVYLQNRVIRPLHHIHIAVLHSCYVLSGFACNFSFTF